MKNKKILNETMTTVGAFMDSSYRKAAKRPPELKKKKLLVVEDPLMQLLDDEIGN